MLPSLTTGASSNIATPRLGDGKDDPGGLNQQQMKNVVLALSTKMESEEEEEVEDKKVKSDKHTDGKIHKTSKKKPTAGEYTPPVIDFDLPAETGR